MKETNSFHLVVRIHSDHSQWTSKCSKIRRVILSMFFPNLTSPVRHHCTHERANEIYLLSTVEPVYSGHPRDLRNWGQFLENPGKVFGPEKPTLKVVS